jgi:ankyrin repeat protein
MYASSNDNIDIVKLLLERKDIDINIKDNDGWTTLIFASEYGEIDVIKLLLEREDIDINIKNNNGWTALIFALHDNIDIVNLLNNYNSLLLLINLI